jgi:hypothetical protein
MHPVSFWALSARPCRINTQGKGQTTIRNEERRSRRDELRLQTQGQGGRP